MEKVAPSSIRMSAQLKADIRELASLHHRSENEEMVWALELYVKQEKGESMSASYIAVEPAPGEYQKVEQELRDMFDIVQPVKLHGDWAFECLNPKQGTMDEAFKVCASRYFEVGWRGAR